ncbi:MAG: hypothetical protein R3F17_00055 [Planctomycetota bacterium]
MVFVLLPLLGLLMVSNIRYRHATARAEGERNSQVALVKFIFLLLLLYLAPVPFLFFLGYFYIGRGLWGAWRNKASRSNEALRKVG